MNVEELRLRTFSTWPHNAPVCPQQLAAGGFFGTGNLLEAECNWCQFRINDWKFGDDVQQRHLRANQLCQFLTNREQCGNVPICTTANAFPQVQEQHHSVENELSTEPSSAAKEYSTLDLLVEQNRLATFKNWPNPNITPQSLAKAGFFYRNRSDEVECAWCKGVIAKWEKQDNAFEEHQRFFPDCPRVLLGPLIEMANEGIRDLGIQQISSPKNPKYTSLDARLRTYTNWPIPDIQKPEELAQAGLYYQKVDDQVRCFHCNMGLRSWEKEDDPWFEHAKWYPMCQFVQLVKGAKYIQEVQELTRNVRTSDGQIVPMTIEEAMTSEPVKLAIEMGIDCDVVRNKTQQIILITGRPYETIEDLLKDVFDEAESFSPSEENTTSNRNNCTNSVRNNIPEIILNANADSINDTNEHRGDAACSSVNTCSLQSVNEKKIFDTPINQIELNKIHGSPPLEIKAKLLDRLSLEEENRKLKDARLCKVCLDEEVGVVYLPCGHLVTCVQCAPGVNQCPMCRTTIKGFVRTYLS